MALVAGCSHWIEVPQQDDPPLFVCGVHVSANLLNEELGPPIWVGGPRGELLGGRDGLGLAVHGGG